MANGIDPIYEEKRWAVVDAQGTKFLGFKNSGEAEQYIAGHPELKNPIATRVWKDEQIKPNPATDGTLLR